MFLEQISFSQDEQRRVEEINSLATGLNLYESPRKTSPESNLPFLISPTPLSLTSEEKSRIEVLGPAFVSFFNLTAELYRTDPFIYKMLGAGKPPELVQQTRDARINYLFLRPDLILTEDGFRVCEIETSIFGLGLAYFLTFAYEQLDFEPLCRSQKLLETLNGVLSGDSKKGVSFYLTENTKAFLGQIDYLARVLKKKGLLTEARILGRESVDDYLKGEVDMMYFYRAFYLYEMLHNPLVEMIVKDTQLADSIIPSISPQMEEKAILSLIFNPNYEPFLRRRLGERVFEILCSTVIPTWVINGPQPPDFFPEKIRSWSDLAKLSRRKRGYVLKPSGFDSHASWSKGLIFLNQLSRRKAEEVLEMVSNTPLGTWVIQRFIEGRHLTLPYFDFQRESIETMTGKVRLTPYFFTQTGELIASKATMRYGSDYIHATSDSINTAVI